jgi:uncharacterized protein YecE (DUF72 family)
MIRTGCCGFPVSRARYFERFRVVEIQQTFYQPPEPSLARKWRGEAPSDFEYTLKAWQRITHGPSSPTYRKLRTRIPKSKERNYGSFKPTEEVRAAWERTLGIAEALNATVIIFQCPASFEPSSENKNNLRSFFKKIDRGRFALGWEPRGKWEEKDIGALCRDLDLVRVLDPFAAKRAYGSLFYYRLHGRGGYRYRYTDDELRDLAASLKGERSGYVMFNNVFMFEDAARFQEMISRNSG